MTTTVHNAKTLKTENPAWREDPDYVYIGRANGRYRLSRSKWQNPFKPADRSAAERARVMEEYRAYIHNQPELLATLHELKGKKLVCWCHPEACHGDILAALADALPD